MAQAPILVSPQAESSFGALSSDSLLGSIVAYGVAGLLLLAPLAFGAVESWAIFSLELGSTALFLLWLLWQVRSGEVPILRSPLVLGMFSFAALAVNQISAYHA